MAGTGTATETETATSDVRALFVSAPVIARRSRAALQVRGVDMAAQRGNWHLAVTPTPAEIEAADVLVVVKWTDPETLRIAADLGKPVAWQMTDLYQRIERPPAFADWVAAQDLGRIVRFFVEALPSTVVLATNEVMRADFETRGQRAAVVPSHVRPDMAVKAAVSEGPLAAVYDGEPGYLDDEVVGMLRRVAERIPMTALRTTFNGQIGALGDLALSWRAADPRRWLHLRWKPATKPVNALGAGVPVVSLPEQSALELASETGMLFFWDEASLYNACLTASDPGFRRAVIEAAPSFRARHGVESAARALEAILRDLV